MSDTSNSGPSKSGTPKRAAKAAGSKPAAPKTGADRLREGVQKARDTLGERVIDPAKRAGEAMRTSGKKLAAGNAEIGLKMLDQAEQNVQQAFAAMRAAAKAKDLSEVMKIQAEFLREQSERSMAQAKEIGELIAHVGREAVNPLRPGAK
ncbi:MAG TPA: phasin family protein [Caulobacteraceae bacterium]|nr:phasin family protein [Caulobacteraceae bacterium]